MVNIWTIFHQAIGTNCPLCHAPGQGLCQRCRASLVRNAHPCPRCALPLPESAPAGSLCADCQRQLPPYDSALVPLVYTAPLDGLVAQFKYRGALALGRVLADLLGDEIDAIAASQRPALLLPVPMHSSGLRERGFNQAAELARRLADRSGIDWSTAHLRRARHAEHQKGLGRSQRQRNLAGAFACNGALPEHVAIVDDVVTTGATAAAVSKVLRKAGCKRIEVWAVARTGRDMPATR